MGCMRFAHAHIEGVIKGRRADLGTFAAAVADVHIDKTGLAAYGRGEITRFTVQCDQFAIGGQFNIEMPSHLDQAW